MSGRTAPVPDSRRSSHAPEIHLILSNSCAYALSTIFNILSRCQTMRWWSE